MCFHCVHKHCFSSTMTQKPAVIMRNGGRGGGTVNAHALFRGACAVRNRRQGQTKKRDTAQVLVTLEGRKEDVEEIPNMDLDWH